MKCTRACEKVHNSRIILSKKGLAWYNRSFFVGGGFGGWLRSDGRLLRATGGRFWLKLKMTYFWMNSLTLTEVCCDRLLVTSNRGLDHVVTTSVRPRSCSDRDAYMYQTCSYIMQHAYDSQNFDAIPRPPKSLCLILIVTHFLRSVGDLWHVSQ